MKNVIKLLPIVLFSSQAIADPSWYGNLNLNTNVQENYNPLIDEVYMDSNYSYIGIRGDEKVNEYSGLIKSLKYKIEFDLEINDEDRPIKLYQAVTGLETNYGNILIGHQKPIQSDLLFKPMNIFNASRVIALEETGYVNEVIKNTVRFDTRLFGFYVGASISMDNSSPESRAIDSQSVGLAMRKQNYQYGVAYWKDNNFNNNEGVSYLGVNFNYKFKLFGVSGSVVKPTDADLPQTTDIAVAMNATSSWDTKIKYGNVEDEWKSYGIGFETNLNKKIKTYIEYQQKNFDNSDLEDKSLFSVGVNYKL